jgi:hypothetical protein
VKILVGCTRSEQRQILSLHNWGDQRAVLIRPEAPRRTVPRQSLANSSRRKAPRLRMRTMRSVQPGAAGP